MDNNKTKWFKLVNGQPRCRLCDCFYSEIRANETDKCPNCGHSTKDERKINS